MDSTQDMKDKIASLLEDELPLVNLQSDFLYKELDSLGIITILMKLSDEFGIELTSRDASPMNFRNLDTLTALVIKKSEEKG